MTADTIQVCNFRNLCTLNWKWWGRTCLLASDGCVCLCGAEKVNQVKHFMHFIMNQLNGIQLSRKTHKELYANIRTLSIYGIDSEAE